MKKVFVVSIIFVLMCINILAETEKTEDEDSVIIGSWINIHNFYYSFDNQGVMKVININSDPVYYNTFKYELISMGFKDFIRYGKDLSDSTLVEYMFIGDIIDSTAVFAYGKTFIRDGSGIGLLGTWKYYDDLSSITWTIEKDGITYRQMEIDFTTGEFNTIEEHHGIYKIGSRMKDGGWFYINFEDGTETMILPIIFKDIIYVFDLNPSWSTFNLSENIPTYNDYKKALK